MTIDPETQARKLATIRSLLAQAEDPAATEAEAETYNRKAAQLIAQYGIDAAMLAETAPESDPVGDRVIPMDNPYAYDKLCLLHVIAEAMRCQVVAKQDRQYGAPKQWAGHLFGHRSDIDRTELLFTSLLLQSSVGVSNTRPDFWWNASASQIAAHRRSWLAGFAVAVQGRLRAAEVRAKAAAPQETSTGRSTDLVLADRTALVQQAVDDVYPNAKTGKARRLKGDAFGDGHRAGSKADLGSGTLSRNSGQRGIGR